MLQTRGRLRFQLLGKGSLLASDSSRPRLSAQKGFALLAYLAMNPGRPISRSILADLLWGDRGEAQARQNLRQAILTIRRDLGAAYSALLQVDDQAATLLVDVADVDA